MEEPNKIKPKPLKFQITSGGLSLAKAIVSGSTVAASSVPARAGGGGE